MMVFHYCAEILKRTPLFETCSNRDLMSNCRNSEGAIFNDFDNDPGALIDDGELEEPFTESSQAELEDVVSDFEDLIEKEEIDTFYLQADSEDPQRWIKDHPLFDYELDFQDPQYIRKVEELLSLEDWDFLPIYDDDEER